MYLKRFLTILIISQFTCFQTTAAPELNDSKLLEESVNDMYIVAGGGLGGAVLGLSTLSFVEEPGDHLKNILVGAALGIMGGVAFVGYSTANKGRELYYDGGAINMKTPDFATSGRIAWHKKQFQKNSYSSKRELPFFVWASSF